MTKQKKEYMTRLKKLCIQISIKNNESDHNIQELWTMIKRPKLRIHETERSWDQISKGIESLFNEIIAEKHPNLEKEMNIQTQETFTTSNKHGQILYMI